MKRFFKMNYVLLSTLLLSLCGPFYVNCGLLDGFRNWAWGSGSSEQVSNEIPLVLAVEKSGLTYLANNQFVRIHMNDIYEKFLFLCPADSPEEEYFNNFSKTRNALFMKKIHQNLLYTTENDIIDHRCETPVKPSIIKIESSNLNLTNDLYSVGYEVYLGTNCDYYHLVSNYESAGLTREGFVWFNIYTIEFNPTKLSVVNVFSHYLAFGNNKLESSLEMNPDYSLGMKELYGNIDISTVYSKKHQQDVFNELYGNVLLDTLFPYLDITAGRYLEAVHLAHSSSFGLPLLRKAGMTYGNIIPMWSIVYNHAWWIIEKNLDELAQGVNGISIITGVYGTLEFKDIEFYLGPNKTVEVPAAFFKIVSYSPNNEEKYNMVIVTNNNPFEENDINEKICKQNQCKIFGWEDVQLDELRLGRTTCCQLTEEVLTELKLQAFSKLVDQTLDLNQVPHWRTVGLTLNIKAYIRDHINSVVNDKRSDDIIYKNQDLHTFPESEELTYRKFITRLYKNYDVYNNFA